MSKEVRTAIISAAIPLLLALTAFINAKTQHEKFLMEKEKAQMEEAKRMELSDDFQSYIEYVMKQRGCEP